MIIQKQMYLVSMLAVLLVSGCAGGKHQDLKDFMSEVRSRPAGEIEPIPNFRPYKPYKYTAAGLRSPFQPPQVAVATDSNYGRSTVGPDDNRRKEHLEAYSFTSLEMVGTLARNNVIWAIINDGSGGVHRVKVNNFLGRNHGKVVALSNSQVDVIEIVPDGKSGWIERPRVLALKEK